MKRNLRHQSFSDTKVVITLVLSLAASLLGPWLLTKPAYWESLDFTKTGDIGDTIGGIIGPILSFGTMLLVYFSFQKQFEANELQKAGLRRERLRHDMDRNFDLIVRLLEQFRTSLLDLNASGEEILKIRSSITEWLERIPGEIENCTDEELIQLRRARHSSYKNAPSFVYDQIRSNKFLYSLKHSTLLLYLITNKLKKIRIRDADLDVIQFEIQHYYTASLWHLYIDAERNLNFTVVREDVNPYNDLIYYFAVDGENPIQRIQEYFDSVNQRRIMQLKAQRNKAEQKQPERS